MIPNRVPGRPYNMFPFISDIKIVHKTLFKQSQRHFLSNSVIIHRTFFTLGTDTAMLSFICVRI